MGAVQTRLVQLGIAKQTAKASAAAAPVNVVGLTGGKVYDVELEESDLDTTWNNRVMAGYDRTQAVPVVDATVVAMPKSIGTLLLATLGGLATTGAGPYTHTFTIADTLPYVTLWGKMGGTDSSRTHDAKVDSFEFSWEKSAAATVKVKFLGCEFDPSIAFPTPGAGVAEVVSSGVLKGMGGTFTVDGASARVIGGSIKIENGLDVIVPSYRVLPDDVIEARAAIEVSLKIKPDNLTFWRKIVTGTTGGTAVSANPLLGQFTTAFAGPSSSTLTFSTADSIAWTSSMPDADPNGGAAELTLTGRVVIPATGNPITVTLINGVTSY